MPAPTRLRSGAPARLRTAGALAALSLALAACAGSEPEDTPQTTAPTPEPTTPEAAPTTSAPEPTDDAPEGQFGVAAGDPAAVEAGMSVLAAGGNAVDAAIATAFAVAVVEPYASGIGGGGSAIIAPGGDGGQAVAYDYREVVAQDGEIPASGIGIPGFVAGMASLHEAHGQAEWAELLEPAITLAAEGYPVSGMLAQRLNEDVGPSIVAAHDHFASGGSALAEGDVLVQEELAQTMRTLAEDGAESFYTGGLADGLSSVPGIDAGSLAGYEVVSGEPVRGQVGEHEVLAPMPPLPGAPLIQMFQVAHALDTGAAEPGSVEFIERISRAWEVADESTGSVLGDPTFVDVPVAELTDPDRAAQVAATVSQVAGPPAGAGEPAGGELTAAGESAGEVTAAAGPGNTTHISVVDSTGMAVSMTNTLTHWFGSGEYHAGFFLNDQLTRFSAIESVANRPEPGKRSVSWSLPLMVLDDQERAVLVIGTPGGRLIPNIVTGIYARWAWHGQDLAEAVAAPRFHLEGQTMRVEEAMSNAVIDELSARGYEIEVVPDSMYSYGSVNALQVDPETGELAGAADPRRLADVAISEP